jgi:hypothetical protein
MAQPKVFISYRRGDVPQVAADLHRTVADRLGEESVFFDRLDIGQGDNWRETVRGQLTSADVVLALIGPRWLDELRSRLSTSADDVLRFELATALAMGKRVIPVLVEGAMVPAGRDLPADIAPLADRQAAVLTGPDLQAGVRRLLVTVHVPWSVALVWATANVAAAGVGLLLAVGLMGWVTDTAVGPSVAAGSEALKRAASLQAQLAALGAGALFGLCVGMGQWLVLRNWMVGLGGIVWAQAMATGLAAYGLALSFQETQPSWGLLVVPLLWYPLLGLIVWLMLRRHMSRAGWFALAHTALPAVALLVSASSLSEALAGPQASLWNLLPVWGAHLLNGVLLVHLMRRAGLKRS